MNYGFMSEFCALKHQEDLVGDAISGNCEEYQHLFESFLTFDKQIESILCSLGPSCDELYEAWTCARSDLDYFVHHQIYLMGASDRENMLR